MKRKYSKYIWMHLYIYYKFFKTAFYKQFWYDDEDKYNKKFDEIKSLYDDVKDKSCKEILKCLV